MRVLPRETASIYSLAYAAGQLVTSINLNWYYTVRILNFFIKKKIGMEKNEVFEIKRFSDIYLSKTKTQNGYRWTKIDQRCGCTCNQNLINDEFGFVCHHVLDLHRQIDSTHSNQIR